jgi:hypothetical protein
MLTANTKKIIILFMLLPVIGMYVPSIYFYACPMMNDGNAKKMACCNHEPAGAGEQISGKCCCEISKAESTTPPTTYLPQQNESFQKVEKLNQFETGLCNFLPEIDFSHSLHYIEISPQNKLKLETKIYTLVSSLLI